uniref:RING-type domain-containing protein n=2 Tax=Panagrolaimus sp. JU765 TaxID=591449 RepID=A0AC34PZM6_9BILA
MEVYDKDFARDKIRALTEIFPRYHLGDAFHANPNGTLEDLVQWVLKNENKLEIRRPRKLKLNYGFSDSVLSDSPTEPDSTLEEEENIWDDILHLKFFRFLWSKFITVFRWFHGTQLSIKTTCLVCYEEKPFDLMISCAAGSHNFCRSCIRHQATSVAESAPLSKCGRGMQCMQTDCSSFIDFAKVRCLVTRKTRKRVDNRLFDENMARAGVLVERCRNCNFAVELLVPKEANKVLHCPMCKEKHCRFCEQKWDDEHFGVSCQERFKKIDGMKRDRMMELTINEAVVRKCHKCNLQFTKYDGCNKITCRCGAIQCYICKEKDVQYNHYCKNNGCSCKMCHLWEKHDEIHNREINQIKKTINKQ